MHDFSLNIRNSIRHFTSPVIMGILNVTPDSFFENSRACGEQQIADAVKRMANEGADIIDVGGCSTRPGSHSVDEAEEMRRVKLGVTIARREVPHMIVSVDTFRASVAKAAVEDWGADIINDISGGTADEAMFSTIAHLHVPYVLTHMRGTPSTMQELTSYNDVGADVVAELSRPLNTLRQLGVADVIVDPGFGFAKTLEQNYRLMAELPMIERLTQCPILVGISRKSMITKACDTTAAQALAGTCALNTIALQGGASILRVHDVAEARQVVKVSEIFSTFANGA